MKKALLCGMFIFALLFSMGCQQNNASENINVDVENAVTEGLLVAINNSDYEGFSKDFSATMKEQITEELFDSQILMIKDIIGYYEEDSKEILNVEVVDKNYTRIFYNAQYSNEEGNVIITMVFNNNKENPQVEGLFFNSSKLQKIQ